VIKSNPASIKPAFTLVEMLVVIAIISILMTAGSIGLSGIGGKGVTSGVATAESLFYEARSTAVGRSIRSCVLIAKDLENNSADDLRRILVAYEELDKDGNPLVGADTDPTWTLSNRGAVLPDQIYFSERFSSKDYESSGSSIDTVTLSNVSDSYKGSYYIYRFNSQGISRYEKGASFVIGNGTRVSSKSSTNAPPKIMASAKRDFGGFVIWPNGRTSVFRSPEQIGTELKNLNPGDDF
jgi:prepilin-type N-terminal cleavage/methylation domain-containing protein